MPTSNNPQRPWIKPRPTREVNQGGERANRDVYDTVRWRKLRKLFLAANPLCVTCYADRKLTSATVVDHIRPINDGADPWDESNWQALCASCHNRKRQSERRTKG